MVDFRIYLIRKLIRFFERKSRLHNLKPYVVLLAKHYTYILVIGHKQRSCVGIRRKFGADEMPFRKGNNLRTGKGFELCVGKIFLVLESVSYFFVYFDFALIVKAYGKRIVCKVPRKSYPCRNDNIVVVSLADVPFTHLFLLAFQRFNLISELCGFFVILFVNRLLELIL